MPDPKPTQVASSSSTLRADAAGISEAAHLLAAGEVLAFPTETVYGLGADAENPAAIARVYALKGRPANHPLIVHLASGADPAYWVANGALPHAARALIDAFWPGPLTLILARAAHLPDAVSGGQASIGLRCPSHPVAQALLRAFCDVRGGAYHLIAQSGSGAIAAPSANRFGRVSPTAAQHVRDEFGLSLAVLDGGVCEVGIESTIVDLSRGFPALLRPGRISAAQLADVLGEMPTLPTLEGEEARQNGQRRGNRAHPQAAPRAPGTLRAHYAPRIPLALLTREEITDALHARARGERIAVLARGRFAAHCASIWAARADVRILAVPAQPDKYAHDLYALLRRIEKTDATRILVEALPIHPAWSALADRLGRAAAAFSAA